MEEIEVKQELAVITGIRYGLNDEQVGMVYAVKVLGGETALFMDSLDVTALIAKHKISDLNLLKGAPCVVEKTENSLTFIELA